MMMCQAGNVLGSPCFACRTLGRTTEECRDVGLEPNLTGSNRAKSNRVESRPHNMYQQYVGKRIVKASLAQGHPTYILMRREIGFDIEKVQMLLSFKKQGARLVEGSFSDHQSLVDAVKQVDVVICTISGVLYRSHNILLQLKLIDAIKEAGNIKRFLPSEFGMDLSRMGHALDLGQETFDKMIIRKATEEAGIPYTYISANCLGCYFVRNLSQLDSLMPPKDRVYIYSDGNHKGMM